MQFARLAGDLETEHRHRILFSRHVLSANFEKGVWILTAQNRTTRQVEEYRFDALVLSDKLLVIPNQYAVLSAEEETDAGALSLPADMASDMVVVLLVAFAEPLESLGLGDLFYPTDSPVLRLLVRDSSKPGRAMVPDLWVAHSTGSFAKAHISSETGAFFDEGAATTQMQEAFFSAVGCTEPTIFSSVFAWDHSRPTGQVQASFKLDESRVAGLCGDLFCGSEATGVEAAVLSGARLADALLPLLRGEGELKAVFQ